MPIVSLFECRTRPNVFCERGSTFRTALKTLYGWTNVQCTVQLETYRRFCFRKLAELPRPKSRYICVMLYYTLVHTCTYLHSVSLVLGLNILSRCTYSMGGHQQAREDRDLYFRGYYGHPSVHLHPRVHTVAIPESGLSRWASIHGRQ